MSLIRKSSLFLKIALRFLMPFECLYYVEVVISGVQSRLMLPHKSRRRHPAGSADVKVIIAGRHASG